METHPINEQLILKIYRQSAADTHKGIQGHALIIGGSYGKIGAVTLATKAALKAGCGLVTAYLPRCGYQIVQTAIPEVMVITDRRRKLLSKISFDISPDAIGIGPGMGQEPATQKALHEFLIDNLTPLVIDADALNTISANKNWLELLPKGTILTPHRKEFERIVGTSVSEADRIVAAIQLSKAYNVIIVLKGAPTLVIDGDSVYQNTTGNAALATAGSGDVLTGIITGLRAQKHEPLHAALLGVYLHGKTADIALPQTGTQSFIASDIIAHLGNAYLSIEASKNAFKSE